MDGELAYGGRTRIVAAAILLVALVALGRAVGADAGGFIPGEASQPAVSADGRFVAFTTGSDLGGPVDPAAGSNVYVYDRERRRVELVSRRSKGAGGQGANGASEHPAISGDGRFVAFRSDATNLDAASTSGVQAYVYDRKLDRVELVSRQSEAAGGAASNGSVEPDLSISGSGRHVGFATAGDNLGGPIQPGVVHNAYVYDRESDRVRLVSRQSSGAGGAGADASAARPDLSASGRYVAFESAAGNLVADVPGGSDTGVYVYDRREQRVALVSRRSKAAGGAPADAISFFGRISGNGRFVAFVTYASNLGGPRKLGVLNIYVYDRERRRAELVSRRSSAAGGAGGDGDSGEPDISASGRFVTFHSTAANLVRNDEGDKDVFVYDRERERVELVSRRSAKNGGRPANGESWEPSISGSGRVVGFWTFATNLGGPRLASTNVYAYDRRARRAELISRSP